MHVLTVAEAAMLHADHLDGSIPPLNQGESSHYLATVTEFRDEHIKELRRFHIHIDLDLYTQHKRKEVFRAPEDPCRVLQDLVRSVYRGLRYEV